MCSARARTREDHREEAVLSGSHSHLEVSVPARPTRLKATSLPNCDLAALTRAVRANSLPDMVGMNISAPFARRSQLPIRRLSGSNRPRRSRPRIHSFSQASICSTPFQSFRHINSLSLLTRSLLVRPCANGGFSMAVNERFHANQD